MVELKYSNHYPNLAYCLKGVVVDGAVRDVDRIVRIDFPVFTKHSSPTAGEPKGFGEIGCEIVCGGQKVRHGDWVVGDDDGVCCARYHSSTLPIF